MPGGMRFDSKDIREMPLHMQEQVGVALLAQMAHGSEGKQLGDSPSAKATPVAGRKVRVRKLCFPSQAAAWRYLRIRALLRSGSVCGMTLRREGAYIRSVSYLVMEEF